MALFTITYDGSITYEYIIITRKYPKRDLSLGPSTIAVFEDYKATALTTQPPWLDEISLSLSQTVVQEKNNFVTRIDKYERNFYVRNIFPILYFWAFCVARKEES